MGQAAVVLDFSRQQKTEDDQYEVGTNSITRDFQDPVGGGGL
jgi:hypothetical protein